MLPLQCTNKRLKELKTDLSLIKDTDPVPLWHANLLTLDRRKCVLFTNDKNQIFISRARDEEGNLSSFGRRMCG